VLSRYLAHKRSLARNEQKDTKLHLSRLARD
jgi:hypothetical protein